MAAALGESLAGELRAWLADAWRATALVYSGARGPLLPYAVGGAAAVTLLAGVITALYVWVASRQVRPRKVRAPPAKMPTSPTSKRLRRRSKSFSELLELERERREENEKLEHEDHVSFPAELRHKFTPEQLKLIYDTLSKVFSFLRGEFVEPLARDLCIVKFDKGDEIFGLGKHDGSILLVAAGAASLNIHGDDPSQRFKKKLTRGDTVTSSLPLLATLVNALQPDESTSLSHRVCGQLSAYAEEDSTVIFQIPMRAIQTVLRDYPESFFRLTQAVLSQVEKITAKALIDHFGLAAKVMNPTPLVHPLLLGDDDSSHCTSSGTLREYVDGVSESIGLTDDDEKELLYECAAVVSRSASQSIYDDTHQSGVFVVLEGSISVQISVQKQFVEMYRATKGCEIGILSCVIGLPYVTRTVCTEDATLLWIPESVFSSLLQDNTVAMKCARHLMEQYSSLVLVSDTSFDWLHLQSGENLFSRGDVCDSVFTVISGRLRAVQFYSYRGKQVETTSDLVRGATLGALDMLSAGPSNSSVFAIRDSQISQMSRNVFDYVVSKHPTVLIHFTKNLARRMPQQRIETTKPDATGQKSVSSHLLSLGSTVEQVQERSVSQSLPLGTIAVMSLTKLTRISTFCSHLRSALETLATVEVVSSQKAKAFLGDQWISQTRVARANLNAWLGDMESSHELVIYEADMSLTAWTKLCIRQADHILLLCSDAHAQQSFVKDMVPMLEEAWDRKNVSISVVRVREENWTIAAIEAATKNAESSKAYLIKKRLHLVMKNPMLPRFLFPMEKFEWISSFHNVQFPFQDHRADFLRLARRVTGNAVGLVLGGGGARGLAHIGVLKALQECGVHVDVIGGTSIGAMMGALYAMHPHDMALVEEKAMKFSLSMSSVMEKLKDLTLPISSFFNGGRFNRGIREHFFDLAIEDLMLNYFCVTTDIAKSRMSVHRSGPAWKYVRASMSLQGYLPPISENGSLLLDGGYMNNLPADIMKEEGGIKYILAVDVGSETRRDYYGYGSSLSGWWLLWNKLNPFSKTVSVPSMGDVSAALAYVASEQHKDRIRDECIDLYVRPPVKDYGTLQFDKMNEIIQVGYDYALPRIRAWAERVLSTEPNADIVGDAVEPKLKRVRSMW